MFFIKNWASVRSVTLALQRRKRQEFQEKTRNQELDFEERQRLYQLEYIETVTEAWEIFERANRRAILLPNGSTVDVDQDIFNWPGINSLSNHHIDLTKGTVGSSDLNNDADDPYTIEARRELYGPFLGFTVLVPKNLLEYAKGKVDERGEPSNKRVPISQSPNDVAKAIGASIDIGEKLTKTEYRETFAPNISVRAFETAWKIAVEQHPELAKPGRPSKDK